MDKTAKKIRAAFKKGKHASSIKGISDGTGLSTRTVSKVVNDTGKPSRSSVIAIAKYLGVQHG